jgi:hypothetical protein
MGTRKTRDLPARLKKLRQRFERWRGTHKARSRIPDGLWASAVKMAGTFGLHRTARALRLDYYVFKKRIERQLATAPNLPEKTASTFLELPLPASAGACDCALELENVAGAKMRVHLKAVPPPDLAALSRSFWNPAP